MSNVVTAISPSSEASANFQWWRGLSVFFRRSARGWLYFYALALVGIVGFLDYITGYEVAFYPFYSIPILLLVWFGARNSALAIAGLCALVWWGADVASGHPYSSEWWRAWDAAVRLMFFVLVVVAGLAFKKQRDFSRAQLELSERSRQLEQEIISASEREQARIGRDLHDDVCQYLVAIGYTAELLRQDLEKESSSKAGVAGEIANLLKDAVVRTRDLARGLSPVDSDQDGLASALEGLAVSASKLMGVSCELLYPETISVANNSRSIHLFRIAQEAVSNAVKHGHAKSIIIALEESETELSLRISDDGDGFDPEALAKRGMGLSTMRYRAEVEGGRLDIEPNIPRGTVVTCTIQNNQKADESAKSENL